MTYLDSGLNPITPINYPFNLRTNMKLITPIIRFCSVLVISSNIVINLPIVMLINTPIIYCYVMQEIVLKYILV
jgi:hypothetical protein